MIQITVVYEDEGMVVLEKPVGVVCNRAETVKEETLQDYMEKRIKEGERQGYFWERRGMVHRLDKETSGLLVWAKNAQYFESLLGQFKERVVKKEYLALTHGMWKEKRGRIMLPLGRSRHNRRQMGVVEGGRESETEYEVLQEWQQVVLPEELKVVTRGYTGFSLVSLAPLTGRTHQLRVHTKQRGHPIVGDSLYVGRKRGREDRKWAGRLLLQARKISLIHPVIRERMNWESREELLVRVKDYLR